MSRFARKETTLPGIQCGDQFGKNLILMKIFLNWERWESRLKQNRISKTENAFQNKEDNSLLGLQNVLSMTQQPDNGIHPKRYVFKGRSLDC